ncbi:VOC family protein [Selenomonas ruminantium]|uniref:VOC family protein n=1 Tax=Selenomonas ruminantium TaxID=971 RepID=UPI00041DAEE9|nr:VOC family protein [Selenomonas ruminantium]
MMQGIHHLAIIVSSEECVKFYKKFGFKEFKRIERNLDIVLLLQGDGIQLEMFVDASHPLRSMPEPLGLRHIALKVDDIEKVIADLGLINSPIMNDWVGARCCFIKDPDGNTIELHE